MSVLNFSHQRCQIDRVTTTRGEDGEPTEVVATIATSAPCRFDPGIVKTVRNVIEGASRADRVAGTLYIDGSVKDDAGNPLDLGYKDRILILPDDGPYDIFLLNRVAGNFQFDHYELYLMTLKNR